MLGFSRQQAPAEDTVALRNRIGVLEDKVRALESEVRTIQGEWAETHTQLMRQANRLRRYQAVDEEKGAGPGVLPLAGAPDVPMAVLRRRGGGNGIHP